MVEFSHIGHLLGMLTDRGGSAWRARADEAGLGRTGERAAAAVGDEVAERGTGDAPNAPGRRQPLEPVLGHRLDRPDERDGDEADALAVDRPFVAHDAQHLGILEPNLTGPGTGLRPALSDWSGFTRILGL
jgi:hypothetical protein